MDPTTLHGGAYRRGAAGVWTYSSTGAPVPGAHDITLADVLPHVPVGDPLHGVVWVSRPFALAHQGFRAILDELPDPPPAFNLPGPVADLPDTKSVFLVPVEIWNRHGDDVVAMAAPELQAGALMTLEAVAAAAGLSPASLAEYIRRGACPAPQVHMGRTPLWSRPVVAHWLATRPSQQAQVDCSGCGLPTEVEGLMIDKATGEPGILPLCLACQDRLVHALGQHEYRRPLTVGAVRKLLQTP